MRKAILQWIVLAKKDETRCKRIIQIAELASENLKPKQLRERNGQPYRNSQIDKN